MTHTAFTGLIDLASEAMGGQALLCSDDFFAEMDNLVSVSPAVFKPEAYTERGKWMDGWESRRRRTPGHDWCILKLGVRGRVSGFDIDTSHFLGNHPPYASIDACSAPPGTPPEKLRDKTLWTRILRQSPLQAGAHNYFACRKRGPWTHLRLNIYPDGGVARLRVFGTPHPDKPKSRLDLASAVSGGQVVACSDMFFGRGSNLILPTPAANMGGGWESRRRRDDSHDWSIIQLGRPGRIERLEIDTNHFKGNFPDRCSVQGIYWRYAPVLSLMQSPDWVTLLPETKMSPDKRSTFKVTRREPFTHLRLNVFPCGGVSRFSAFGLPFESAVPDQTVTGVNDMATARLFMMFHRCCGSKRWAEAMVAAHPFQSAAEMFGVAEHIWWHLEEKDWRQAFKHHPEIGTEVSEIQDKHATTSDLSAEEQAGIADAALETLSALATANATYRDRFGFVFLISATGKSADDVLSALRMRIMNSPEDEVRHAAAEQAKITRLRLEKLL